MNMLDTITDWTNSDKATWEDVAVWRGAGELYRSAQRQGTSISSWLSGLENQIWDLQRQVRQLEQTIEQQKELLDTIQSNPAVSQAWQDLIVLMALTKENQ